MKEVTLTPEQADLCRAVLSPRNRRALNYLDITKQE
jgi:hypothetical protein